LKHKWTGATFKKPKGHPVDYPVPNFGVDHDILTTQNNLKAAEKSTGHTWQTASFKAQKEPPINYFVPNFGMDRDIQFTLDHAQMSESKLKHKWTIPKEKPADPPMNYYVPNFGMDKDIADSLSHTASAERKFGKFDPENLAQTESDIKMGSDPICSSAGCNQYKFPKKDLGYDLDYPVPNLGQDREIKANFNSLKKAEQIVHHNWVFGTKESKDKWKNPAKEVMYDYAPDLDRDVKDSQASLSNTESYMGHTYHLF
jgi:hypothetical protein